MRIRIGGKEDSSPDRVAPVVGFELLFVFADEPVEPDLSKLEQGGFSRFGDRIRKAAYAVERWRNDLLRLGLRQYVLEDRAGDWEI
jgi:hypothetical protein